MGGTQHLLSQDLWVAVLEAMWGMVLFMWPPAPGQAPSEAWSTSPQDSEELCIEDKMSGRRCIDRGVEGADGWMSWVGKGQVSPGGNIWVEICSYPGIQGRSIPGQGKSPCKHKHHCPSHPFFDAKRKERKSIIAFKYLLNKVLLLKLPRIQLSCQYKTYPPLFPFRTQPSHRPCCLPSSETPVSSVLVMSISPSSVSIPYAKRSCIIYAKHNLFLITGAQKMIFLLSYYFIYLIIPNYNLPNIFNS